MVSRNLERANENDGFKMTALEKLYNDLFSSCWPLNECGVSFLRGLLHDQPYWVVCNVTIATVSECYTKCNKRSPKCVVQKNHTELDKNDYIFLLRFFLDSGSIINSMKVYKLNVIKKLALSN